MKIAIVGCGQLAQMMAQACQALHVGVSFLAEPKEDPRCVAGLGEVFTRTKDMSAQAIYDGLGRPDVITVEREHVSVPLLKALEAFCSVYPSPDIVAIVQNRLKEKTELMKLGIPVAKFRSAKNAEDIKAAIDVLGFPVFVKTAEEGYDGKNQWRIDSWETFERMKDDVQPTQFVVEAGVAFSAEASIIGARSSAGEIVVYPMTENTHRNGILVSSSAPINSLSTPQMETAKQYLHTILSQWNYVGVIAVELFVTGTTLIVNELAPRVHNSGHWTMDGTNVSQFENHIRAIAGKALGDTTAKGYAAMVNLLGTDTVPAEVDTDIAKVYSYNKVAKPGRKMGHINICSDNQVTVETLKSTAVDLLHLNLQ